MGLGDIRSRDAVLDAIDEFEDSGAAAFLQKYGTGVSTSLKIDYVGKEFPALPILVATHQAACGSTLEPEDIGSDFAAQQQLEKLGFRVVGAVAPAGRARATRGTGSTRSSSSSSAGSTRAPAAPVPRSVVRGLEWSLQPDDLRTRQELAAGYGISKHSTIDSSARVRSVFLFSFPTVEFGLDGWTDDRSGYRVVADGRRGDQTWNKTNQQVLTAAERKFALRLFEEVEEPWRPGGRRVRYLGEFILDPSDPWQTETAPDADGRDRNVFVFRLIPAETPNGA